MIKSFRLIPVAAFALLAASLPAQPPEGPMAQSTSRQMTRVLFFSSGPEGFSIPCQYVIHYGNPQWKAEHEDAFKAAKAGDRFRLGTDFWPTLDTNRNLTVGGVKVPIGGYYLAVEKAGDDKVNLVLLDQAEIRAKRLDAFQVKQAKGGIVIPLKWEKTDKSQDALTLKFVVAKDQPKNSTLGITWGPHQLTAPVVAEM